MEYELNEQGIAEYFIKSNHENKGTILFIHGYTGSFASREKLFSQYPQYNWCGIDFPNHGNSLTFGMGKLRLDYFADLIFNFVKKRKLENLIILGHSMGGAIALVLTYRLKSKIKLLILDAPANPEVLKNEKIISYLIPENEEELKIAYQHMIYDFEKNPNDKKYLQIIKEEFEKMSLSKKTLKIMLEKNIWNEAMKLVDNSIKHIQAKTIIIFGDKDKIVPYEESIKYFKKNMPKAFFETINNVSHLAFFENKEKYFLILNKYLI